MLEKTKKEKIDIEPEKFVCVETDGTIFNFNKFKRSLNLASNIYRNRNLHKDKNKNIKQTKNV